MKDDEVLLTWLEKMRDLGVSMIDNAPKNENGFQSLIERVGAFRQRYHPTNVFTMDKSNKLAQGIQHSYQLG
jgi:gamma-butyrobetaine dioxygenase